MRHRSLPTLMVLVVTLTGCTVGSSRPDPDTGADGPDAVAAALAVGVASNDLAAVPFAGTSSTDATTALRALTAGMGPLRPAVTVGSVDRSGSTATARLDYVWTFPGVPRTWTYPATATLTRQNADWRVNWQPTLVQPELAAGQRLSQRRLYPARGEVLGESGDPIVVERPVFRIGLDKAAVKGDAARASARRLAKLVGIDPSAYAKKVAAAGPEAFVEAIVLRRQASDLPRGRDIRAIPGALSIQAAQMLAPTRDFARPILGSVGEATEDAVKASNGAVVAGDQVGLSGLQKRYDEQLRGTPGVRVQRVGSTSSPSADPSPGGSASPDPATASTLFEVAAVDGAPLTTTLRPGLQRLAERVLSGTKPASALVALQPSTGAVLAAANGPGTKGQSVATVGQAAPGSTFKVVSSLALLRAGLRPGTAVQCPRTITVDGRSFRNYSDYPTSRLGRIDLQTALAQSCNTAFISQRGKVAGPALSEAAGSLGLGTDYDVGFPSYFGSVPDDPSGTALAAAMIGQGQVQASALAMAAVVGSVSAGKTVVPHLIEGRTADPTTTPLTGAEAKQLRAMMRQVVTTGSGRVLGGLDGPDVIAKTGTAEYGGGSPLKTHAWMIAAQGDLAVAVFVNDGATGSRTAGPLLAEFLSGTR